MSLQAGAAVLLASLLPIVSAHEHHHDAAEIDMGEPFDGIIITHMVLQAFLWAILFPVGMVLGMIKSKYHVPLQTIGVVLNFVGTTLAHHHGGREFPATVHGTMAKIMFWVVIVQAALGIFLKLHIMEKKVRPWVVPMHGVIGKMFPVLGWTQMLMGVATAMSLCNGGHLGQCLAHYIMGSAFIGYGVILVIMLNLGGEWLKRTGKSQEMLDSIVITLWGIVNTFTEHHGGPWTHKDMQHTMMGVLWWAGGLLGIYSSRGGKRSWVPAVIILMTGWAMSAHHQALELSTQIHTLFGYSLMAAGVLRLVEVCFLLKDQPTPIESSQVRVFQYLPPYLLVQSGVLFISATDEELRNADSIGVDHGTYAMVDFSFAFLIYLVITFLVQLYSNSGKNAKGNADLPNGGAAEAGYLQLSQRGDRDNDRLAMHVHDPDGPEAFELTERDDSLTGDSDAVKIGGEDEVDWIESGNEHNRPTQGSGALRL